MIMSGKTGFCRSRKNINGTLYAINFEQAASRPVFDPIEKKPLYHFYPGASILSLGPNSCNLACRNCQNWTISQMDVETVQISSEELVDFAKESQSLGVAYTYTEPFTWFEFILETAPLVRGAGMKNVLVTNGYVEEEPLKRLLPFIDALNIDIKSMDENFYRDICQSRLEPVLRTTELAGKTSHVEITNLVLPTLNDKKEDFEKLTNWIFEKLGPDVPLHFSRYFPNYKMKIPPTDISNLELAMEIAQKKLNYVYIGNVADVSANTTFCTECRNELIQRIGYLVKKTGLKEGRCVKCGKKVAGIGMF